jgi:DNA-binding transcriptional MocR family regulator
LKLAALLLQSLTFLESGWPSPHSTAVVGYIPYSQGGQMAATGEMAVTQRMNGGGSPDALYLRLQSDLEKAIREGEFVLGSKLPPERQLAEQLHVSRTTVTNAYRELEAKGLVRGYVGRGTYVCALPQPSNVPFAWRGKMSKASLRLSAAPSTAVNRNSIDPKLISFALGCPALENFPAEEYCRIVRSILSRSTGAMGLGAVTGQPALREAIAKEHSARADQVLVVAGSQQGLDLLARCLVDPGDYVIVDRPGYFIAFQTFQAAGARLIGWDALRSDLDELENLILRYKPKFICTTPSFQNPTGRTLSLNQRKDLVQLATRYRVPLIEDDPYRELYFDAPPPPSLHALDDRGVVIHLGTFSKVLAPGLRLGYIIAPENVVELLALTKERAACFTAGLEQLVVAEMLGSGMLASHAQQLRHEHRVRRDAMILALRQAFPKTRLNFSAPGGGLYLWCHLSSGPTGVDLNDLAIARGVVFAPGEFFYPEVAGEREIRLCFAGSTVAKIRDGADRLKNAFVMAIPSRQQGDAVSKSRRNSSRLMTPQFKQPREAIALGPRFAKWPCPGDNRWDGECGSGRRGCARGR